MSEIEVSGHREILRELRILEVAHARRIDTGAREPVVEPGRRAAAEVGADCLMERSEDLQEHEHDTDEREREREGIVPLDRADERAHRDREHRREGAAQSEDRPPQNGEPAIGPHQDAGQLPLVAFT